MYEGNGGKNETTRIHATIQNKEVRQGCVMSPLLFNLYIAKKNR